MGGLVGWLVVWLVGWLVDWLVGWLVGWPLPGFRMHAETKRSPGISSNSEISDLRYSDDMERTSKT